MEILKAFYLTLLSSLLVVSGPLPAHSAIPGSPSPKTLFKNYALSTCIAKAFEDADLQQDASTSAADYLDYAIAPPEAYEEADRLAQRFLQKENDIEGSPSTNTMKCITFYHSYELEELAERYIHKNAD